jgi:hypothetical protein
MLAEGDMWSPVCTAVRAPEGGEDRARRNKSKVQWTLLPPRDVLSAGSLQVQAKGRNIGA